ncbi:MAG: ABC transporter permease [Coriobacteriia bacterium]|nr:ABC transporter permease [Coriobacteriia bacterium]
MISLVKNELVKIYAKSGYILAGLVIAVGAVMAPISKAVFEVNDGASYLYNLGGNLGLVNLFTIFIASTILNAELSKGTVKFLLLSPYNRTQIILSKIVAMILNSMMLSVLLLVTTVVASIVFFNQTDLFAQVQTLGGTSAVISAIVFMFANVSLTLFYIMMMLALSVLFKSQVVSSTIGFTLFFSGVVINIFVEVLFENFHHILQWSPFNVVNFRDKLIGVEVAMEVGSLSAMQMGLALSVYTAILFLFVVLIFNRLDID